MTDAPSAYLASRGYRHYPPETIIRRHASALWQRKEGGLCLNLWEYEPLPQSDGLAWEFEVYADGIAGLTCALTLYSIKEADLETQLPVVEAAAMRMVEAGREEADPVVK